MIPAYSSTNVRIIYLITRAKKGINGAKYISGYSFYFTDEVKRISADTKRINNGIKRVFRAIETINDEVKRMSVGIKRVNDGVIHLSGNIIQPSDTVEMEPLILRPVSALSLKVHPEGRPFPYRAFHFDSAPGIFNYFPDNV